MIICRRKSLVKDYWDSFSSRKEMQEKGRKRIKITCKKWKGREERGWERYFCTDENESASGKINSLWEAKTTGGHNYSGGSCIVMERSLP